MKTRSSRRTIQHTFLKLFPTATIVIALLAGTLQVNAGDRPPIPSTEQMGLFMNSTTCVVLEDGSVSYNIYIKDAVEKHWKITDYEIIDRKEFEERRFKSKYSFLVLVETTFEDDPEGVSYNFLNLLMGGGAAEVEDMPELVSIPLAYDDDPEIDYGYAMPAIIEFVQRNVRFMQSRRLMAKMCGKKYFNRGRDFRDKALLLMDKQMAPDVNTLFSIKEVYPNYVKLVTLEELETTLEEDSENVLFLHHVGPEGNVGAGRCFEMIFDPQGELYYYNYREVTNEKKDGFTKKDLRKIRY